MNAKRIAFLIINFDDRLCKYKANYYKQIDQYLTDKLSDTEISGMEIVFFNQKTAFHTSVTMKHATVINEGAPTEYPQSYAK